MNWYLKVIKNYATFAGRARRKEYWFFILFQILIGLFLALIGWILGVGEALASIYALATFIPTVAVMVRRLHDINFSGWWALLSFIPIINIAFIVLVCLNSTEGDNRFGGSPKYENDVNSKKTNTLVS